MMRGKFTSNKEFSAAIAEAYYKLINDAAIELLNAPPEESKPEEVKEIDHAQQH